MLTLSCNSEKYTICIDILEDPLTNAVVHIFTLLDKPDNVHYWASFLAHSLV